MGVGVWWFCVRVWRVCVFVDISSNDVIVSGGLEMVMGDFVGFSEHWLQFIAPLF